MDTRIGILTIHGMGEQEPDFDRELRRRLLGRLSDEVVTRDVAINAGSWLLGWTPLATLGTGKQTPF